MISSQAAITISDILQWINVLLIPAFIYIVKLERRIIKVETLLEIFIERRLIERNIP
jgi:hypothetical protein